METISLTTYKATDTEINRISSIVAKIGNVETYGVMTACFINGEFVFCSDHSMESETIEHLEGIAKNYPNVSTQSIIDWDGY